MRQLSSVEIDRIQLLTESSVEITLIEPTQTGLEKSIMDATGPVRTFLREKRLHDYDVQRQGPHEKVLIDAFLVNVDTLIASQASLYRPQTKKGDPRIWFKGLGSYAKPNDILAIFEFESKLYVINITRLDIEKLIKGYSSSLVIMLGELPFHVKNQEFITSGKEIINPLKEIVEEIKRLSNKASYELLVLLKQIAARGPIPALLEADTAIGRTLETLLGISINSSKKPDYKGIEIKSFREKGSTGKGGNRKTLFAQVPNWALSKFKSSAEILRNFGYERKGKFRLYCTVSTLCRNSQGLQLRLENKEGSVVENALNPLIGDFAVWSLETLHKRLQEKHSETFWVAAESTRINDREHFIFKKVEHTRSPIISQFDILVEQGIITLDHLISKDSSGKVSEGGPLFKIEPNSLGLLFPPSNIYPL